MVLATPRFEAVSMHKFSCAIAAYDLGSMPPERGQLAQVLSRVLTCASFDHSTEVRPDIQHHKRISLAVQSKRLLPHDLAHSSHHLLLPPPRRPLTGPTPPKFDPRMKKRTPPPNRTSSTPFVVTGPFIKKFPCNQIINIKKKSFSGEAKDSVIFSFFILLHKRAKPIHPPYIYPSAHLSTHTSHPTHPPIPPQPTFNPSVCPAMTVECMDV
jgi:hypothetical protein